MKRVILPVIVIAVLVLGFVSNQLTKKNSDSGQLSGDQTDQDDFTSVLRDSNDLCLSVDKNVVGEFLGKTIPTTNSLSSGTLQSCQYFLDDTHALVLNHDYTSITPKIKGHELLERTVRSNDNIPMKNYVVTQDNGLINEIYLVLSDTEFVSINRPNGKLISDDEVLNFAIRLANYLRNGGPATPQSKKFEDSVPRPGEEDIIRNFFNLIHDKNIPAAISMMSTSLAGEETTKQAWGVQFNDIKAINALNIEPVITESWTETSHTYKVTLEVYVSSDAASAPIPFYGWEDNPNFRWVEIVKEGNLWKINSLATGQ